MCCEQFATAGIEIAIVRLSNVYGPGDRGRVIPRFVESALSGLPMTLFGGDQVMDFVWIETVLDALVRLGFGPSLASPINVGSGRGVSIVELCERVIREAGSKSGVEIVPARGSEVVRYVADIRAAQETLGLESPSDPLFGLPDGIAAARLPELVLF
jgi:nucleoside-diphosphate-sugar epimerase